MIAVAEQPQDKPKSPASPEARIKARAVEASIRQTLSQATKLKDLAFQAALEVQAANGSPKRALAARVKAQAIVALTKSWAESVEAIRVTRGKPLPGSLKPESKPKKSKSKMPTFSESKPD